jgi:hypothetical protein
MATNFQNNFKNNKMKKITTYLLLWALIALGFNSVTAQNPDCEPCQPGTIKQVIIPLCYYEWNGQLLDPLNNCQPQAINTQLGPEPFVFVILNIREVTCNGVFKEYIEDAVFVENGNFWDNYYYNNGCNQIISNQNNFGCPYLPLTPHSIKQAIADAIAQYVGSSNIDSYLYKEVVVKGSCYSLVKVEWPEGAFYDQPTGDSSASQRIYIGNSESFTRIPCSDACCLLKMQRIEIVDGNGITTYKWTNIGVDPPTIEICEVMPLPDYNSYNPKPNASMIDPITGEIITIEGTFISQEMCEAICPTIVQSNGFFKTTFTTDLVEAKTKQIQLTASPIPAKNVVTFNTDMKIKAIKVYDSAGRRVYKDAKLIENKLDISSWNAAQYYIQVILENDEVKTLKILKN